MSAPNDTTRTSAASDSSSPAELTDWEIALEGAFQRYMTDHQRGVMQRVHDLSGKPGLLIDFGCGPGRWTRFFVDRGWQAICIDIDASSLSRAQATNPKAQCILSTRELRRLPAGDGEVGLVLCIGVYRMLESDWFLGEVRRVLKRGGLFSGAFFNTFSARGFYRYTMDKAFGGQNCYVQSYGSWRRRARRDGFEFLEERGLCWFPIPSFSNSPIIPFFTGLERASGLQRLPSLSPWVTFIAEKRG